MHAHHTHPQRLVLVSLHAEDVLALAHAVLPRQVHTKYMWMSLAWVLEHVHPGVDERSVPQHLLALRVLERQLPIGQLQDHLFERAVRASGAELDCRRAGVLGRGDERVLAREGRLAEDLLLDNRRDDAVAEDVDRRPAAVLPARLLLALLE